MSHAPPRLSRLCFGLGAPHAARVLSASAGLLLLVATQGIGQAQRRPEADSALRAALHRLRPGALVRVQLARGTRVSGKLVGVDSDSLRLQAARPVPLGDLGTLWVRGRSTCRGATIGAVTGGAAGLGVGLLLGAVVAAVCEYDCPGRAGAMSVGGLAGAVAGAAGGGLLGAVIGAAIPRWERKWP